MADLFLSYSRKNEKRAALIADGLGESGHSLWWDNALKAGDNYALRIEQEIALAKGVVVCWSRHAKESLWVRAEATEALDTGKLVQLKLDDSRMPLPFNMLQMIEFAGWNGGRDTTEWRKLADDVVAKTGGASSPMDAAPADEAPVELKQRFQGLGPVAAIGVGLTLLTALIALATVMLGEDMLDIGLYRSLTLAGFGAASLGAILVFWRVLRTTLASRRS